jgi:uncharacterized membrane protein YhfC
MVVAAAFEIVLPLLLAVLARRRYGVGWRYFGIGALVFFLSQIVLRLPAMQLIQAAIAPQLLANSALLWGWLAFASVSAGVFEEVGRYLGFRVFLRHEPKTWAKGVMTGLGHGGLESMLLVGGLTLLTAVNILALTAGGGLDQLPPEQRDLARTQLAAMAAQPTWLPLLGLWERLATLPVHVALSVMVIQVFRRGRLAWLWLAIAAHGGVNLLAVSVTQVLGREPATLVATEVALTLIAFGAIWVIRRLRDESAGPDAPAAPTAPVASPSSSHPPLPDD